MNSLKDDLRELTLASEINKNDQRTNAFIAFVESHLYQIASGGDTYCEFCPHLKRPNKFMLVCPNAVYKFPFLSPEALSPEYPAKEWMNVDYFALYFRNRGVEVKISPDRNSVVLSWE